MATKGEPMTHGPYGNETAAKQAADQVKRLGFHHVSLYYDPAIGWMIDYMLEGTPAKQQVDPKQYEREAEKAEVPVTRKREFVE
jgi:hypothetical protein